MTEVFVSIGIDVSKSMLDIHCLGKPFPCDRVPNDSRGIARLVKHIVECSPSIIVCEPSGAYERPVVTALRSAGLSVALVNARWIRDFARSKGILAKTDAIDAQVLAEYGATMRPTPKQTQKPALLAELVQRRRYLVNTLGRETRQAEHLTDAAIRREHREHCAWLKKRIAAVEGTMRALIAADPVLKERHSILKSCKGVGEVTATVLLADMPELGTATHPEIASLAGVAPFNCDSGGMRGQRHISGGKANVREVLYMAAVAAMRSNPDIRKCYERHRANGKPAKVAIVACMRKLLIVLNSLVRDERRWMPEYLPAAAA